MTDPNESPDADDARWFRSAVGPVVDTQPVPDAWDAIHARATGERPDVVRLAPTSAPSRRPARRRLALVAAAVLAVAGIGGAVAITSDDGGDGERVDVAAPAEEPTGWYVPEDLPDGWALESVATDWMDVEVPGRVTCPCTTKVWTSPDATLVLMAFGLVDDGREVRPEAGDPRAAMLGRGVTAYVDDGGSDNNVSWSEAGTHWRLMGMGLTRQEAVSAARSVVARPSSDDPPLAGMSLRSSNTVPTGTLAYHSVLVTLLHQPSGRRIAYGVVPEGFDAGTALLYFNLGPTPVEVEGQQLPVDHFGLDANDGTRAEESLYVGRWPGAEVYVGRYVEPAASEPMEDADLRMLVGALRPATSDEWRTFLDTASGEVDDDARADRLSDLIVYDGDRDPKDGDPSDVTEASPETQAEVVTENGPNGHDQDLEPSPAEQLHALAPEVVNGLVSAIPTDLFAPTVSIGLDFQTNKEITDAGRELADPESWVIDEDRVEQYAGRVPPFSAIELLAATDSIEVTEGPTAGCSQNSPTEPPLDPDERFAVITPTDVDSCLDWYAVLLVLDAQNRITGVHLYLREP